MEHIINTTSEQERAANLLELNIRTEIGKTLDRIVARAKLKVIKTKTLNEIEN